MSATNAKTRVMITTAENTAIAGKLLKLITNNPPDKIRVVEKTAGVTSRIALFTENV